MRGDKETSKQANRAVRQSMAWGTGSVHTPFLLKVDDSLRAYSKQKVGLEPQIGSYSQVFSFPHSLHLFLSQAFSIFFGYSVVHPKRNSASNNSFLKEEKGAQSRICISHVPNKDSSFKNSPENGSLFLHQACIGHPLSALETQR